MQATKVHGARSTSAYHTGGSWTIHAFAIMSRASPATDVMSIRAVITDSLWIGDAYVTHHMMDSTVKSICVCRTDDLSMGCACVMMASAASDARLILACRTERSLTAPIPPTNAPATHRFKMESARSGT